MEVTLEKIEIVKDRTGVSYKEAKDALENADGSVVDAIINIEDNIDSDAKKNISEQSANILEAVKEVLKKGNVSKIIVKQDDGDVLLNLPLSAGIIATLLAPWGVLAGVVSTFAFKCTVELVKSDGSVVDVTDMAQDTFEKAKNVGGEIAETAKKKTAEAAEFIKDGDVLEKVKDKAGDIMDFAEDKIDDIKDFAEEKLGDIKNKAEDIAEDVIEGAEDIVEDIKEEIEDDVNEE